MWRGNILLCSVDSHPRKKSADLPSIFYYYHTPSISLFTLRSNHTYNSAAFRPSADLCKFVILQESQKTLVCEFGPKYVDFFHQTHVLTSKVYCKCNFFLFEGHLALKKSQKGQNLSKSALAWKGYSGKSLKISLQAQIFADFVPKSALGLKNFLAKCKIWLWKNFCSISLDPKIPIHLRYF